jgi:hypothetical protein
MIWVHVSAGFVVHHVYSVRMLRKPMVAVVFSGVVLTCVWLNVIYAGFRIILNEPNFDKDMVYEKIQVVAIYLRQFVAVHVHFVKKLVFLNATV